MSSLLSIGGAMDGGIIGMLMEQSPTSDSSMMNSMWQNAQANPGNMLGGGAGGIGGGTSWVGSAMNSWSAGQDPSMQLFNVSPSLGLLNMFLGDEGVM